MCGLLPSNATPRSERRRVLSRYGHPSFLPLAAVGTLYGIALRIFGGAPEVLTRTIKEPGFWNALVKKQFE